MIEINFLTYYRQPFWRQKKSLSSLGFSAVILFMALLFFGTHWPFFSTPTPKNNLPVALSPASTPTTKSCLLDHYGLNDLRLLGTLLGDREQLVIILSPDKQIVTLKKGDEIGKECQAILAITAEEVQFNHFILKVHYA